MKRTLASAAIAATTITILGLGLACRDDAPAAPSAPPATVAKPAPVAKAPAPGTSAPTGTTPTATRQTAAPTPARGQTVTLGDLGVTLTVPEGWSARWKNDSGLLEVARGGRLFYVERFDPAKEAGLRDVDAAVAMVRSFEKDGFLVESLDKRPLADGFIVTATTRDDVGRQEPHLFVVRHLAENHLVCRLGPGIGAADVPTVTRACESLRSRRP